MKTKQTDLFLNTEEGQAQVQRSTLKEVIELSTEALQFAEDFDTWLVGYSGGKDSSATVALIDHLIKIKAISRPKNLVVIHNDTLIELPPLQVSTANVLTHLQASGWRVFRTQPRLKYYTRKGALTSGRFFVQMLGVGYAPSNSQFTWCRERMKLNPLKDIVDLIKAEYGESLITIDGVRIGESINRDRSIYTSCRKDDGECGSTLIRDVGTGVSLSPIAHWRVCHVADWLIQADVEHSYPLLPVLEVYGADIRDGLEDLSARTGCVGCPLVTAQESTEPKPDKALLRVLKLPQWSHLEPLLDLGKIYWQLHFDYSNRHIWDGNSKGNPKRHGKPGPLTLTARKWALERILDIEARVNREAIRLGRQAIQIIQPEELELIKELQNQGACPEKWSIGDPIGGDFLEPVIVDGQLELFGKNGVEVQP